MVCTTHANACARYHEDCQRLLCVGGGFPPQIKKGCLGVLSGLPELTSCISSGLRATAEHEDPFSKKILGTDAYNLCVGSQYLEGMPGGAFGPAGACLVSVSNGSWVIAAHEAPL